jgi:hypothetical protein
VTTLKEPGAGDVRLSTRFCREQLEPHVDQDWDVRAGSLDWSCRETAAHISDALGFYTAHLAIEATEWLKFDVVPHADAMPRHLIRLIGALGVALAAIVERTAEDARAFHHSGIWDRSTIAAMGCLETLVHTGDISAGLGIAFKPPGDLCQRIIDRLFAGAPRDADPWRVLWWATGRGEYSGKERLGPEWLTYWVGSHTRGG